MSWGRYSSLFSLQAFFLIGYSCAEAECCLVLCQILLGTWSILLAFRTVGLIIWIFSIDITLSCFSFLNLNQTWKSTVSLCLVIRTRLVYETLFAHPFSICSSDASHLTDASHFFCIFSFLIKNPFYRLLEYQTRWIIDSFSFFPL